jgi:IMP dehydrogenase
MCTTRMVTGVGRPTFTAVKECAEAARALGKFAWADGGVKNPRDLDLYIAAGATRVMAGTLFAGTFESAEDVQVDADGKLYKSNHGMASARAVRDRNGGVSALEQAVRGLFEEGISTSQVYLRPGRESVGQIVAEFVTGLMSSCTYNGARTLDELFANAVVGVQTPAGFQEGTPHGRVRK